MSKMQRTKGRAGQLAARHLLQDRDWAVHELNAGTSIADFVAISPTGCTYSVEVKNAVSMNVRAWRKQAVAQAGRLPWMLLCKVDGTGSWLVLMKASRPCVWHEKGNKEIGGGTSAGSGVGQ
jgi:hypothetical protein